jgi:type II secretory pathway pseudopilin PulG
MRMELSGKQQAFSRRLAFTLAEVMVGVGILSIIFASVCLGLSQGFSVVQVARENLRATEILQEKMETIRLYDWSQINSNGFIPPTFSAPFYDSGDPSSAGVIYTGQTTITAAPMVESYAADHRLVIVTLTWKSGNVRRERHMTTLVSRYGMHDYIYD